MLRLPGTAIGWGILLYAIGGVVLVIANPVFRLAPVGLAAFEHPLGPVHYGLLALWMVFMVYAEGWRGFHKQFSPRVVVRALAIANRPRLVPALFAPLTAMGLIHATRKRLIVSRSLLAGIVVLVILVRQLEQPWRGLIDLGVVAGLTVGLFSILGWFVAALAGRPPQVPSDLP